MPDPDYDQRVLIVNEAGSARTHSSAALLASAARTATVTSADITNPGATGAYFLLSVTGNPGGAETLTFAIQAKGTSGQYKTITAFASTTANTNANYIYLVDRGSVITSAVSNFLVQGVALPETFRYVITHSASGSWTYSLDVSYLP